VQSAITSFLHSLRKVAQLAQLYNVSKSSLQHWIHNDPTIRKVRCKKQTDNTVVKVLRPSRGQPVCYMGHDCRGFVSQRCQLKASRSTAGRLLKKAAGYTRKTACRVVNTVQEPTAVMTFCQQYQAAGDDIVCIDEAGFYVGESKGEWVTHSRASVSMLECPEHCDASSTLSSWRSPHNAE
jgi:hypothetical protein